MAEFLITAQDSLAPDGPGRWYAARIVDIQEDGFVWGNKEVPPKFGLIKVPGVLKEDAIQYLEVWRHHPTIEIITSDTVTDSYRLRLTSTHVSQSGKNAFTIAQVEKFIEGWGGSVVSISTSEVVFDINIFDAITSSRFWDADVSGIIFSETSYDSESGSHVVQVVQSPFSLEKMKSTVKRKGGTIIPPDSFMITRQVARTKFIRDIENQISQSTYAKRRWYITSAGMNALLAAGGVITVTPQQFVNNVRDGLDD